MTWNHPLARPLSGRAPLAAPETSRMRSGLSLTLLALAGLAGGCSRNHYDEKIEYPVRTDFLVPKPAPWGDLVPPGFNRPGLLPLDALRFPQHERPEGSAKLEGLVGKTIFDPTTLPAAVRTEYAKNLNEMFGTPAHPKVSGFEPAALKALDENLTPDEIVRTLKVDDATLAEGSRHYRMHCMHCHGMEGNGRGPTGPWLNPPPRDYRLGIFKYTSSTQDQNARKPRRADILHVLEYGIEGTSMPSFNILPLDEREAIASYVIHLSLRGEVEGQTMTDQFQLAGESKGAAEGPPKYRMLVREDFKEPKMKDAMQDNLALAAFRWAGAQKPDAAINPGPYRSGASEEDFLSSAGRGSKIFYGSCVQCHQNFGRESNLVYDAWGTIVRGRNLYEGIYRGGRRPVDLYYRVHGGIEGAGMPAYKDIKTTLTAEAVGLTAAQFEQYDPLWDIVNFFRAVSYRDLREKLRGDPYKVNLPE
jgi:mono/diheme cytochrome c family protein